MKIIIIGLVLSSMAFAMLDRSTGDWGTGGGNAIICFDRISTTDGEETINILDKIKENKNIIPDKFLSYIKSIEMYDLYEAKKRRGLNSKQPEIIKIKDGERIYSYIERLTERFQNLNYEVVNIVYKAKSIITDDDITFNSAGVLYQNDLGSVTLPNSNCIISTMAAQVNYNDHYQVHIDERLYNHAHHSKQSKATLILHELIYAYGRKNYHHKDSGSTRELVRMLISFSKAINEGSVSKLLINSRLSTGSHELSMANKYTFIHAAFSNLNKNIYDFRTRYFSSDEIDILLRDIEGFLEMTTNIEYQFDRNWETFSFLEKNLFLKVIPSSFGENLEHWKRLFDKFKHYEKMFVEEYKSVVDSSFEFFRSLSKEDLGVQIYSYDRRVRFLKRALIKKEGSSFSEVYEILSNSPFALEGRFKIDFINDLFFARIFSSDYGQLSKFSRYPLRLNTIIPKK